MIQVHRRRRTVVIGLLIVRLLHPAASDAQTVPIQTDSSRDARKDAAKFMAGAALGLLVHETGHVVFDESFDARPRVEAIHFGPIPFFAIAPTRPLSARQLFTVASAGFWTQELSSELLQRRRRDLRHEHAPFAKGIFAFDVLTSVGYGAVALLETGPVQRDTRGMAVGLGVSEPAIGAIIVAPAVLEIYRYYRPESCWAKWATRALAVGSVLILVSAPHTRQ